MCVTKPLTDLLCLVMCTNYKSLVHLTWHSRSISGIVISMPNLNIYEAFFSECIVPIFYIFNYAPI